MVPFGPSMAWPIHLFLAAASQGRGPAEGTGSLAGLLFSDEDDEGANTGVDESDPGAPPPVPTFLADLAHSDRLGFLYGQLAALVGHVVGDEEELRTLFAQLDANSPDGRVTLADLAAAPADTLRDLSDVDKLRAHVALSMAGDRRGADRHTEL